jgi:hypothetical protein
MVLHDLVTGIVSPFRSREMVMHFIMYNNLFWFFFRSEIHVFSLQRFGTICHIMHWE